MCLMKDMCLTYDNVLTSFAVVDQKTVLHIPTIICTNVYQRQVVPSALVILRQVLCPTSSEPLDGTIQKQENINDVGVGLSTKFGVSEDHV